MLINAKDGLILSVAVRLLDYRMYGASLRNLLMFRGLCGENCFENIVLATTHWPKFGPAEIELRREKEFIEDKEF